jgi:GH15 family glucan-1,4-alpha-glucosidase
MTQRVLSLRRARAVDGVGCGTADDAAREVLPATDQRIRGTVAAIEKELLEVGFVQRYTQQPGASVDGLPPGEGAFLACTFWLAQNYALMGP